MLGSIETLALATACFVGGHFILSSVAVRNAAVGLLGENGFRALYSLLAMAALAWTVLAYRTAPEVVFWKSGMLLKHIPVVLMPFACILAVAGLTTRSVTIVGGEAMAADPRAVSGITTITRHPFLWAVFLWAAGHLVSKGEAASLVLFGGMAILALGGMAHIDHRRRVALGADWGPVAMTTSVIPFMAAIQGRRTIDWRGIGWARFGGGVALYLLLPWIHPWIAGARILPDFMLDIFR